MSRWALEGYWQTISAFANTRGGWIALGVADNGDVLGLADPHKFISDLYNLGRNKEKISHEVWGEDDIFVDEIGGHQVVGIRVPEISHSYRPVYVNNNPMTGTFIRRNEGDYLCNGDEVKRMIRDAAPSESDSSTILDFRVDCLERESIEIYRQRFQNQNPTSPFNNYDDGQFLKTLCALDPEQEHPTPAGLLMLGTAESIQRWRKHHLIDYRRNPKSIHDSIWNDRLASDKNLLRTFLEIYPKLTASLPQPHRIIDGVQNNETTIHLALREAFVNLLVHADYRESGSSVIFESQDDLVFGGHSTPRNPTLHKLFRFIGLVEQAGTGFPKILAAWREQGFEMPQLEIENERYEFKLLLRNIHLISSEDRHWLIDLGLTLSSEEQLSLVIAKREGLVSPKVLALKLAIHDKDSIRVLTTLHETGLLSYRGDGTYVLQETLLRSQFVDNFGGKVEKSITETPKTITETQENLTKDQQEEEVYHETVTDQTDLFNDPLTPESVKFGLRSKITRADRRIFIEISILRLCRQQPRTARQLSEFFGLRRETLFKAYIQPLIESKSLQKGPRRGTYVAKR